MGHDSGRGLWNARPPVNIKGIKKKGSAPLEWHSPLHPRVREPRTTSGHKKKMRPILDLMIMGEHNEAIDNQCALRHNVGGGIPVEVLGGVVIARSFGHVKNGTCSSTQPPPATLFCAVSSTRSATVLRTGRSWKLWGLCLWWLQPP